MKGLFTCGQVRCTVAGKKEGKKGVTFFCENTDGVKVWSCKVTNLDPSQPDMRVSTQGGHVLHYYLALNLVQWSRFGLQAAPALNTSSSGLYISS